MNRRWIGVQRDRPTMLSAIVATLIALLAWSDRVGGTERGDAQRIYREGILPSGQPLRGVREAGVPIEGRAAACASCHRRSGIGVNEGRITIPPISGKYLLHPRDPPLPEAPMK